MMGKDKINNNIKSKLRKGLWSPEEDEKLLRYMITKGQGCWSDIARNAGLQRCGKSCRLRWINYLRPDLKRGAFSPQEEEVIIHLHSILGNRYPSLNIHFLSCICYSFLHLSSFPSLHCYYTYFLTSKSISLIALLYSFIQQDRKSVV